jgi:hypothetical protein
VEDLLKEASAARFLNLSPRTLEAWRRQKRGPCYVVLSRKAVRYRPAALLKFMKAREVKA